VSKSLHQEARAYCPETCPDVDRAFSNAWDSLREYINRDDESAARSFMDALCEKVKEVGTEKLRDALCSAISDRIDAERERDEAQDRVRELESEVDDLRSDVSSLERELAKEAA
jgi:polyhydroxyalkanoate synthesis regulator phasin